MFERSLLVCDEGSHTLRRVIVSADSPRYGQVTTLVGRGGAHGAVDASHGSNARLEYPAGVVIATEPTTRESAVAVTRDEVSRGTCGVLFAELARVVAEYGVGDTPAPRRWVAYVSECVGNRIRRVELSAPHFPVTTIVASKPARATDVGVKLHTPYGMWVDTARCALYVCDAGNHSIRSVTLRRARERSTALCARRSRCRSHFS